MPLSILMVRAGVGRVDHDHEGLDPRKSPGRVAAEERHDLEAHPAGGGNVGRHEERVAGRRLHRDVGPRGYHRLARREFPEGLLHGLDRLPHGQGLDDIPAGKEADPAFHHGFSRGLRPSYRKGLMALAEGVAARPPRAVQRSSSGSIFPTA